AASDRASVPWASSLLLGEWLSTGVVPASGSLGQAGVGTPPANSALALAPRCGSLRANESDRERWGMALEAYPSVPLFRYPYTKLTEAQIQAKLMPPARVGPGSKGSLETDLAGTSLRIVTDGAGTLNWQFGQGNRVTFDGIESGYGALTLDHVTLISHIVPNTTKAWAIAWDRHNNLATVFELWWGGGPAPHARGIHRR